MLLLVELHGRGVSPVARPLPTQDITNIENRGQTSMAGVGIEPRSRMETAISRSALLSKDCQRTEMPRKPGPEYYRVGQTQLGSF
jgi:hypothetical protein